MAGHTLQECIDNCIACHRVCLEMAMTHCLEHGGKHVAPEHFRLMINCAEICRTAADFMLSRSPLHRQTCAVCADVCDACAGSCEALGDMDDCVRACRLCAESCREMAGDVHVMSGQQTTERALA
ncbi:MAG: four-helix bundle copper-binding protein [Sulfurifustaceae bacterium]